MKRTCLGLATATAFAVGAAGVARAGITFENLSGAPLAGANYVNFDDLEPGNEGGQTANIGDSKNSGFVTVTLSPTNPVVTPAPAGYTGAAATTGSEGGNHAPPWVTLAGNVDHFDLTQTDSGPDESQYLTSGVTGSPGGTISLNFTSPIHYFGLLWGSVDGYNALSFFGENDAPLGTFNGDMVKPGADGWQQAGGSLYVNFISDLPIFRVDATSTQFAFELDNVAYSATPEAATLTIWSGLGLCGWFAHRRGRK